MAQNENRIYEVGQLPEVTRQVKELGRKAVELGITTEFVEALKSIVVNLQTKPLEWGDPEYRLKKSGGLVHHRVYNHLFVHYAVYEPEQKVLLMRIEPLAKSPLAS